jgi:hypothetical protein
VLSKWGHFGIRYRNLWTGSCMLNGWSKKHRLSTSRLWSHERPVSIGCFGALSKGRQTPRLGQWRWSCPLAIGSNYSFEAFVGPICFSFSPSRTSAVLNIWVLHRPASCCARNGPLRHRQLWPWSMSRRAAGRLHCKSALLDYLRSQSKD